MPINRWMTRGGGFLLVWALMAPVVKADPATRPAGISIIPRPVSLTRNEGQFTLGSWTHIETGKEHAALANELAQMLDMPTGYTLPVEAGLGDRGDGHKPNFIRLSPAILDHLWIDGEYSLTVTPDAVDIQASSDAGFFYGMQTLRELLPPEIFSSTAVTGVEWNIPCVTIHDYPRFQWRGMMLDCSRHFFPKAEVERFIDLMAIHKMNVFHWHLTDDQGWRIQILKYPKLTDTGAWRKQTLIGHEGAKEYDGKPYGGFYTQDDIREVVKYAADRYIMIVPEIEMPGHSTAAVASYPELGNTGKQVDVTQGWGVFLDTLNPQESTISFYQDVLSEVVGLFPSPYVHLGGDEVKTDQWDASPAAQARMKELGLKDSKEIQPYMLRRMAEFLHAHGKRVMGWDEILDDKLPADSVVMCWRGAKRAIAAAQAGNDVVMAPEAQTYFDHYQSKKHGSEPLAIGGFLPLKNVYAYDPVPRGMDEALARHILGSQAQLWSEYIPTSDHLEYMAFPRECAMAEVLWSPLEGKDYADFSARLPEELKRLEELKVNYRHPLPGEDKTSSPTTATTGPSQR